MRLSFKQVAKMALSIVCTILVYCYFDSFYYTLRLLKKERTCIPTGNIVFLKTHKTAGTTVQNIFFRYADREERVVAIPLLLQHLGYIEPFRPDLLLPLKNSNRNQVFAHHTIFNYDAMRQVMPDDAFYVTVLRDPAAQFESAYAYYNFQVLYNKNITALTDLSTSHPHWKKVKDGRKKTRYGRNQQAFDLGVDPMLFDDKDAVSVKIHELDRQFHFVIITELLDQSLVILKEKLCWKELSDVIAFKNYERTSGFKTQLSSKQKKTARDMNQADTTIYDHFHRKLLDQIDEYGKDRMATEVEKLRTLRQEMTDFCLEKPEEEEKSPKIKFVEFKLRPEAEANETCRDLIKGDWPYTLDLLDRQRQLYEGSEGQIVAFETIMRAKLSKPKPII